MSKIRRIEWYSFCYPRILCHVRFSQCDRINSWITGRPINKRIRSPSTGGCRMPARKYKKQQQRMKITAKHVKTYRYKQANRSVIEYCLSRTCGADTRNRQTKKKNKNIVIHRINVCQSCQKLWIEHEEDRWCCLEYIYIYISIRNKTGKSKQIEH